MLAPHRPAVLVVGDGGSFGVEGAELADLASAGGRVVAGLTHDPLASVTVDLGIAVADLHGDTGAQKFHTFCIHRLTRQSRCPCGTGSDLVFCVGLGRFELPTS